jgi:hypothetical protein
MGIIRRINALGKCFPDQLKIHKKYTVLMKKNLSSTAFLSTSSHRRRPHVVLIFRSYMTLRREKTARLLQKPKGALPLSERVFWEVNKMDT